jgi:hypothetical protein
MPNAAVVATALTTHAARAYALWLAGTDIIKDPVSGRFGVDVKDVHVEVNAAGGVSTMSFVIDDPTDQVAISDGQSVVFHDLTNDQRMFTGWLEHYELTPYFGGQGRLITVAAVGPESILDWSVTTSALTFTNVPLTEMITGIVSNCTGVGDLRVFVDRTNVQGSLEAPVGNMGGPSPAGVIQQSIDVESGTAPWVAAVPTPYSNVATLAAVAGDAPPGGGTNSVSLTMTSAFQDQGANLPLPGTFIAGTTYALSFWMRTAAGGGGTDITFGFGSAGTATDRVGHIGWFIASSWTRYTLTWTPTANRTDAVLFIVTYGLKNITVNVDLVTINGGGIVTIPIGTTLREALLSAAAACVDQTTFWGLNLTVDHYFGLRCWGVYIPGALPPSDVTTHVAVNTVGAIKPTSLSYAIDASQIVRAVLVVGTGVTSLVTDGTGLPGRTAVLSDTTIASFTGALSRAQAYINDYRAGLRGSLALEDVTGGPTAAIDALRMLDLTDVSTGIIVTTTISQLAFTFFGGKKNVGVQFGGLAPSASAVIRRLTRGTLS